MPTVTMEPSEVTIRPVENAKVEVWVMGETPVILNRMSEKARRELLLPAGRKTAADRAAKLKHDPMAEFRDSPYVLRDKGRPTYLAILATSFKQAAMTAALDLPGTRKTQIGRHLWVKGERLSLYGVPELLMSVVRSADIGRTPDVHTRVIVPRWAVRLEVAYVVPLLNESSVLNLINAAGILSGVGDWRPEKGAGNYGTFAIVQDDDPDLLDIIAEGGREAQMAAMREPAAYDEESEDLLSWFTETVSARGRKDQLAVLDELDEVAAD